ISAETGAPPRESRISPLCKRRSPYLPDGVQEISSVPRIVIGIFSFGAWSITCSSAILPPYSSRYILNLVSRSFISHFSEFFFTARRIRLHFAANAIILSLHAPTIDAISNSLYSRVSHAVSEDGSRFLLTYIMIESSSLKELSMSGFNSEQSFERYSLNLASSASHKASLSQTNGFLSEGL